MQTTVNIADMYSQFKQLVFEFNQDNEENINGLFKLAKTLHDIETIKILAKQYYLMDAINYLSKNKSEINLTELIIQNYSYEDIKNIIKTEDVYINAKTHDGETGLIMASILNKVDIVQLLLENGANVNDKLSNGMTIVETAFVLGYQEVLDILIEYGANNILENYAKDFFYKVNQKITSKFIAKQFVYEELDAASQGNSKAKKFVENSGIKKEDYHHAMKNSLREVDGANSPQQILGFECLAPLMNENNRDMIADIRILTVDKIMKEYYIGKYEGIIKKITLENSETVSLYNDYALVDNEQFQLVTQNKYYSQKRKIYLEILYDAIVFSKPSYESKQEKEYFKIIHTKDLLQSEMKHNPKRLVEILSLFGKENPLKYSAHSFEWSRYNSYDGFMKELKKAFEKEEEDLRNIAPDLHTKISKFLFDDKLSENNTWGIHKIDFGWSSTELKEWSKIEENKTDAAKAIAYPLPKKYQKIINGERVDNFNGICDVFKNEIEIRDDDRLNLLFQGIEDDILVDFEVTYINLDAITFYTDVENFKYGLIKIFEQCKVKGREKYDHIEVEVITTKGKGYIEIQLTQIGSSALITSDGMIDKLKKGDFKDIKNHFTSLCDWRIEAKFSDGNFTIDCLSIDSEFPKAKPLNDSPAGFTHILRFYKGLMNE